MSTPDRTIDASASARGTIDRWIRAYRAGGFEALTPTSRTGEPVTERRVLDLASA